MVIGRPCLWWLAAVFLGYGTAERSWWVDGERGQCGCEKRGIKLLAVLVRSKMEEEDEMLTWKKRRRWMLVFFFFFVLLDLCGALIYIKKFISCIVKMFGISINVIIDWVATVDLQLLIENCLVCTWKIHGTWK
jgi:hypothetical protein